MSILGGKIGSLIEHSNISMSVDDNKILTINNTHTYHAVSCSIINLGKFA